MAKRKRLTPANPIFLDPAPDVKPALGSPMRGAPIADVAREASASAAIEELAHTLSDARKNGRMVIEIPLSSVKLDYLVRDRVVVDDEDMQALRESIQFRGQKTPIELVQIDEGDYGLISGWRRCMVLRSLYDETGDARFETILALLRQPADSADAYQSMVEENEIRVGLSHFERARIVVKAVEAGVFENDRAALKVLFQSASRPKRSKVGSFLPVVRALEGHLRFPGALGERLGLSLSRALSEDPTLSVRLVGALKGNAAQTVEAEQNVLSAAILTSQDTPPVVATVPRKTDITPGSTVDVEAKLERVVGGVNVSLQDGRLVLEGRLVDEALKGRLVTWLRQNY